MTTLKSCSLQANMWGRSMMVIMSFRKQIASLHPNLHEASGINNEVIMANDASRFESYCGASNMPRSLGPKSWGCGN